MPLPPVLPLYTITIFLGAALLFLVQPMIARMLLPSLGGSPAVWNTCMVFFQAALLAGYAYAHWSVRLLGPRRQAAMHILLVLVPLLVLPVALRGGTPPAESSPIPWLLLALAATIGLPFVVAATGGPLLQRWFAATGHRAAGDPYFLYAASNAGSLLALLSYPALVEPLLTVGQQRWLWSGGYLAFALLTLGCGIIVLRSAASTGRGIVAASAAASPAAGIASSAPAHVGARQRLLWVGLAFIPSSLMLGVTQYLSTDIAAVPLLWVVPLSIYLLTFIIAFSRRPRITVPLLSRILPLLAIALAIAFLIQAASPKSLLIVLHLLTFFVAALLCHLRLAQSRPATTHLTEFYLLIAVGGVMGGIFNALVAPLIFNSVAEYPIAIALALLVRQPGAAASKGWANRPRWMRLSADYAMPAAIGLLAFYGGYIAFRLDGALRTLGVNDPLLGLLIVIGLPAFLCYLLSGRRIGLALGVGALFFVAILKSMTAGGVVYNERTFYGVHRVKYQGPYVELVHSNTSHGVQSRLPEERFDPLAYYSRRSPIGEVFEQFQHTDLLRRVGLVGLGAGALAAYGQPGQHFTFHEIDPAVVRIARQYFTYLEDTRTRWDVKLGDGRLTLATQISDGEYGLLVIDAFSSDAIPVHLITLEAMQLYMRKVGPGGIVAYHISNRYLNLLPVLERQAAALGLALIQREDRIDDAITARTGAFTSHWVLIARQREDFGPLVRRVDWIPLSPSPRGPLWTDDFSNILSVFHFGD
jgi:hypothetical protein